MRNSTTTVILCRGSGTPETGSLERNNGTEESGYEENGLYFMG